MTFISGFTRQNHSYDEVDALLRQSSYPSVDFYVLMTLSVIIASLGLLLNSSAVIIGAMIIAPLMDPLLGVSLSSLSGDREFKLMSGTTIVSGILLGLLVSFSLGSMFSFMGATPEIMARTQPTTLDLLVALASGFMGGYAKVRKTVGGSIFGVAIAISLVPPLSVVGIGFAYQQQSIYLGAGLLFLTNVMSVILSGILAFLFLEFQYFRRNAKSLIFPFISILVMAIPLSLSLNTVMEKKILIEELKRAVTTETITFRNADIISIEVNPYAQPVDISLTARTAALTISQNQVEQVQAYLARKINKPVHLNVNLSPIVQLSGSKAQPN